MKGSIYLIENGELVEMNQEEYEYEEVLQKYLADYTKLLAGDQMNPEEPRRWLLITREASIPDKESSKGRWSVDHLFLDQDGVPTFVEVKRESDTRLRREVVGQMLDYVSNATLHWKRGRIISRFEEHCRVEGMNPNETIIDSLKVDDVNQFWEDVEDNLRSGRIRMLFVADWIPRELKRVVEFLNEQMNPAEVLAIEVKQYEGKDQKALVPQVIGQTEEARERKSAQKRSVEELLEEFSNDNQKKVNRILELIPESEGGSAEIMFKRDKQTILRAAPGSKDRLTFVKDFLEEKGEKTLSKEFDGVIQEMTIRTYLNDIELDDIEKLVELIKI